MKVKLIQTFFLVTVFSLTVQAGSKAIICQLLLTGDYRPEYEMKLYLAGSDMSYRLDNVTTRQKMAYYNSKNGTTLTYPLGNLDSLALHALERYYLSKILSRDQITRALAKQDVGDVSALLANQKFKFRLRPLISEAEHHHFSDLYSNGEVIRWSRYDRATLPKDYFSAIGELESKILLLSEESKTPWLDISRTKSDDFISVKFLVGRPFEKSIYYDTANKELSALGLAVRVKEWRTHKDGLKPEKRQIMIKKAEGYKGSFLHRLEYSESLDVEATPEEIDEAVKRFVAQVLEGEVKAALIGGLKRTRIVETERIGIPLEGRIKTSLAKIGFLSFDAYNVQNLSGSLATEQSKNTLHLATAPKKFFEIEIEIHPEYMHIFDDPQTARDFDLFIQDIKQTFNAVQTDFHKHMVEDHQGVMGSVIP